MLYPCMFCVALSIYLFVLCVACLTVFGETIRNMFGYGIPKSVCCASVPSVRLDGHSICFVCVFVCRKLSPHLRAGSQVFSLLKLCAFAYYVVG